MDNVRPLRPKKKPAGKPRSGSPVRRRVITGIIVALVVLVFAFGSRILGMYVDWLWFGEVGFREVFWTRIWAQVLVGLVAFAAFLVIIWANVELARRLAPDFRADVDGTLLEPRSPAVRRWVGIGGAVVCVIVAFIAGVAASGSWQRVLLYFNQVAWGEKDAQFGRDISFYVFSSPFWQGVLSLVMAALIAALVLAAIVHLIMGGIELKQKPGRPAADAETGPSPFARAQQAAPQIPQVDIKLGGRAVAHLSALLAAIFVVVGIGQLFKAWDLLYSTAGAIYGAAYTDVVIRLPMTRVTMVIAFILAAVLVWNIWRRHQWWPLTIAVWVVALIVLRGVVPAVYQSLIVNPNQLSKERDYIARNLEATREAFGLNGIEQTPITPRETLTPARLEANQATLRNIRLWDPRTLVTSYRQLQELRPYYVFLDADVDRYTVNGVYRQTMLSARELNIEGLPVQAQTWVNQHITYTHGFGVAMSAVNQVTPDGSPDFLVQDVPPRSAPGLEIEQPRIYYGERGTDYTLVNTTEAEFDYPASSGDVYTDGYSGSGGVPISPVLNRLAFSVRYGTIKFFTTSALQSESRLIFRNNIRERVQAAAPFLALDPDPYMVIADGRLWWIQDAYTSTSRYPYSTPQGDLNYLRNSVKIVIDAYNGSMAFYVWDEADPLLSAWRGIYPDLFTPRSEIPEALMEHVRYPETLFDIQAETWTTYHVDGPEILYNKGDQWAIPEDVSTTEGGRMDSYYVIMRLPGEDKEEFIQMLPFVPNGRKNMISWLAARSDEPQYGSQLNILFSRSTTVYGPNQVESAINQDPEISAQRTLWGQQGSEVILGNLLVVPIDESLLYVQPLYLQSEQTQLPQLKRVIVFYRAPEREGSDENAIQVVAMRPTLSEALAAAFGETFDSGSASGDTDADNGTTGGTGGDALGAGARELIARANSEFQAAQEALRAGDFAEYGRRIEALEQALTELQRLQQQ
ncbi:MAG TPA: UPF0182 family protein [Thermoleophilia bacterium]|nr:UPF0182 family protein [Thermoleophilia bacterium]